LAGRPNVSALSVESATSRVVPSSAASRSPRQNTPGVARPSAGYTSLGQLKDLPVRELKVD
jgi:hypothetical protein